MAYSNIYPIITPLIKTAGGTGGPGTFVPTDVYALIGGSDVDSGIPATGGGGGGGAGSPIGLLLALTKAS